MRGSRVGRGRGGRSPGSRRDLPPAPSGFTLVEVIVALVVLQIGLLGVAGLALRALQLLSESSLRSRAAVAVEEVVDSLATAGVRADGVRRFEGGTVVWTRVGEGEEWGRRYERSDLEEVSVVARGESGDSVLAVRAMLPGP